MAGMFDDLIPAQSSGGGTAGGGMFDDLIPKAPGEDVTAGMALRGIPVLGAYIPQAEAAIRAAAQPLTGVGAPGATWSERYAANLPQRQADYAQAERESPGLSTALQVGGGLAATAPLGATALGGRLMGATGGMASRLGFGAASGAGMSAADAYVRGQDPETAAYLGAGLGAAAPVISGAIGRAITPFTARGGGTAAERQAATNVLRQEGVQPSAGTVLGNKALQATEQHLGELSGLDPAERMLEQYTSAALRRVGETETNASPRVLNRAFDRIGKQFDDLSANHTLHPDPAMGPQIRNAIDDYERLLEGPAASAVRQYEQKIATALAQHNNTIPGDVYQSLRSQMETDARNASSGPLANALRGMRGALDSAMERYLGRINSPDAGAWQRAREQYRNLLVLEKAAASPGTKLGLITPGNLFNATKSVQGIRNLVRGRGEYASLAQAGSDLLTRYPSSGTAQRAFIQNLPGAIGGGVLGTVYGQGDPWSGAGGALAGVAGPMLMGRAINSPIAQRYLRNQLLTPQGRAMLGAGMTPGLLNLLQ